MLCWSWLRGLIGLLLAVPRTAFVKLIADSRPSLIHMSNLLAEDPRPISRWARFGEWTIHKVKPFLKRRSSQKPVNNPLPQSSLPQMRLLFYVVTLYPLSSRLEAFIVFFWQQGLHKTGALFCSQLSIAGFCRI